MNLIKFSALAISDQVSHLWEHLVLFHRRLPGLGGEGGDVGQGDTGADAWRSGVKALCRAHWPQLIILHWNLQIGSEIDLTPLKPKNQNLRKEKTTNQEAKIKRWVTAVNELQYGKSPLMHMCFSQVVHWSHTSANTGIGKGSFFVISDFSLPGHCLPHPQKLRAETGVIEPSG